MFIFISYTELSGKHLRQVYLILIRTAQLCKKRNLRAITFPSELLVIFLNAIVSFPLGSTYGWRFILEEKHCHFHATLHRSMTLVFFHLYCSAIFYMMHFFALFQPVSLSPSLFLCIVAVCQLNARSWCVRCLYPAAICCP